MTQHKPLGVAVVPVNKGQEQVVKVLALPVADESIAYHCTYQHEKAKNFDPDKTNPHILDIFYIFP